MKILIRSFCQAVLVLIFSLVVSQLPLSPAYAEENITITTYYPSPSGSYLDLNVQGTMLVGTGTPASSVSSRIEFSHNTSSSRSHWNIDQGGSPSSNNTTNPRLRFFTEPNSNSTGYERFVLDNTSMTFRNSTGVQRLLVNDSHILYTSGATDVGDFILRAATIDTGDPGDIIFQRGNSPYSQLGRIWSMADGSRGIMRFSVSDDNNQPIEIRETGTGSWISPYKNDLHITRGNFFIDDALEWAGFCNRVVATIAIEALIMAAICSLIPVLCGMDIAENFVAEEDLAPGDVAVLNPLTGKIEKCQKPYDLKVVGIITSKPAMVLGSEIDKKKLQSVLTDIKEKSMEVSKKSATMKSEERQEYINKEMLQSQNCQGGQCMIKHEKGKRAVALVGTVPCKVDANFGAIGVGDLLTTSITPGYAMKAKIDSFDKIGTVIAKAVESMDAGKKGVIKVLVVQK